jgi:hypothetical protein
MWSYGGASGPIYSSPAISADKVYVGSDDNRLYCVIDPTGALSWSYVTGGAISSSPAVSGIDTVYVGSEDKVIYSINSNGTLAWSYATGGIIESSVAISEGELYVGSDDNFLYVLAEPTMASKVLKQGVLNYLTALRATITDKKDGHELDEAIKHLTKSLTSSWWVDSRHLKAKDGEKVFDEEKATVVRLRDLINDKKSSIPDATVQGLIDRVVEADRLLAVVAIGDAAGDTARANEELSKGDRERDKGKYDHAIDHYRNAWKHAQRSA